MGRTVWLAYWRCNWLCFEWLAIKHLRRLSVPIVLSDFPAVVATGLHFSRLNQPKLF